MTELVFDSAAHCGAKRKRYPDGPPCRNRKGFKTDHVGSGNCYLHGGRTPNGKRHAASDQAAQALVKLGVPIGDGDPIRLLGDAVRHAQGLLESSAQAVLEALEPAAQIPTTRGGEVPPQTRKLQLEAALELYLRSLKEAHRTAKASVDANIAERMAVINERQADVILRALQAGLDAAGVHGDPRAAAEAAMVKALRVKVPAGAELN